MAQNHIQPGDVMPYTNSSGADIESGTPVLVGNRLGVAIGKILAGESGSLAICEVWDLPKKAATAIGQGADAYWDDAAGEITDEATGNTLAGCAFADAAADDATIQVKLGG